MDLKARRAAILTALSELKEKQETLIYGIELCLKTREYGVLRARAEKLEITEIEMIRLSKEADELLAEIEKETQQEILEVIA